MSDGEAEDSGGPRNIEVFLRLRPVAAPAPDIAVDAAQSRVSFTVQRDAASGRAGRLLVGTEPWAVRYARTLKGRAVQVREQPARAV